MRERIEPWLNGIWYGEESAPAWLRALTPVYRTAFIAHRALGRRRRPADLAGAPILVIGNLTAGGSGKTPLVVRLCEVLADAGLRPGVVTRGYGGTARGVTKVDPEADAAHVGDEALLIARRCGVPVVTARDRCAGARRLLAEGAGVVISDDGLQHHRLPRAMELCVVDAARGFGNGLLLPAGPLREPRERLRSVDRVIVNRPDPLDETGSGFPADTVPMHLAPGLLRALDGPDTWRMAQFAGCRANAVAGIGNPERFFGALEHAGLKLNRHVFPDHHRYRPGDFAGLKAGLPLIMTEKDAVKCRGMPLDNAWYLTVDAHLPAEFEAGIAERMAAVSAAFRRR